MRVITLRRRSPVRLHFEHRVQRRAFRRWIFFFFASPELDGANVVAVSSQICSVWSKLFVFHVLFGAAVVVVVVVVEIVASSSSPSLLVARGFTRAQRFKDRDRFLLPDNTNDDDDDDDDVVVEKERDDDVDANIIAVVLGSDGRDPLSSATTFIVLWCWCVRLLLLLVCAPSVRYVCISE